MTLLLPDFQQCFLQGLSYCSMLHADNGIGVGSLPFRAFAKYKIREGEALLVVQIEPSTGDGEPDGVHYHCHVDVDRIEVARRTTDFTEMKVDELKNILDSLAGLSASSYVDGKYSVARDLVPAGGIINTLLNVSTDVGNMRLEQRGAKFDINGGGYFTGLLWRLEHDDDDVDYIRGCLEAYESTVLDDDYLTRSAESMQKGLTSLILEIEGTQDNDSNSTKMLDKKKKASGE